MIKFWEIAKKNMMMQFRDKKSLLANFLIPIVFYGVIGFIFSGMDQTAQIINGNEINSLTLSSPGFLLYGVLSSLVGEIILITGERKTGVLKRLETTDMQGKDVTLGYLVSNTFMIAIQMSLGLIMLLLFGFKPNFAHLLSLVAGIIVVILLLAFILNAIALILAAILKTPEAASGTSWLILVPLLLFSGALFPLETMAPDMVDKVAWIPTRMAVLILQDLIINGMSFADSTIILKIVWIILEGIGLYYIAVKIYHRLTQ